MELKTLQGLGDFLRAEREKRQITIEQVASATKINIKLLHALESDNFESLPAKPFVRGFVTSYVKYLGMNPEETLTRFETTLDEKSGIKFKRPPDAPHIFVEQDSQKDNSKTILSAIMLSFLVIAIVVFAIVKPNLKHGRKGKGKHSSSEDVQTVELPPSETSAIKAEEPTTTEIPVTKTETKVETKAEAKAETKVEPKTETKSDVKADAKTEDKTVATTKDTSPKKETTAVNTPAQPAIPVVANKEKTKETTPNKTESLTTTPSTNTPTQATIKPPVIPMNEVKVLIVVRAKDDSWVKYQSDDRPVQAFTLKKDKVIWVRGRESLRFSSSKPENLELSSNNKEFRPMTNAEKLIILPKSEEAKFKANPFTPPNPQYLAPASPQKPQ